MIEVNITYPETRFYFNYSPFIRYATFPNEYQMEIIEGFSRRILLNGIDRSEEIKTISEKDIEEKLTEILEVKDDFISKVFNISGIDFRFAVYEELS